MEENDFKVLCDNFNFPQWDNWDSDQHIIWCVQEWNMFTYLYTRGLYEIAWNYVNQNNYENHLLENDEVVHCNF